MKKFLIILFITISLSGLLFPAVSYANSDTMVKNGIAWTRADTSDPNSHYAPVNTMESGPSQFGRGLLRGLTAGMADVQTDSSKFDAAREVLLNNNSTPEQVANAEAIINAIATNANPNATAAEKDDAAKLLDANANRCSWTGIGGSPGVCFSDLIFKVIDLIGNAILSIAAWILWACGVIFNLAIVQFVVEMKARITAIPAIYVIWQAVRDLANMFFIFILLVIAIQTILQMGDYKKMLRDVILVALFINFSFFFTGLIIDASNMIALQFYKGFATGSCDSKTTTKIGATASEVANNINALANRQDGCISQNVVNALKLGTLYSTTDSNGQNIQVPLTSRENVGGFLITVLFGSALMIVVGGVFLASAILIIFRFVELIILLMFSSLAFATLSFPALKEYGWSKWWGRLKKQLIFAPVYFMFLWVTMKIIQSKVVQTDGSFTSAFGGNGTSLFGLISSFVIIIAMLIYSLTLAKELGASGANLATKVSKGFQGYFAKRTAGRGAAWIDKKWAGTTGILGGNGRIGGVVRSLTTSKAANYNYGTKGSFIDYQKGIKDAKKADSEQVRKNANSETFKTGMDALKVDPAAVLAMTAAQRDEHQNKIQKLANLAKISGPKDLTAMKSKDLEALAEAGMLTPDKMSAILDDKNENHTGQEKDAIRAAYSKKVNDALTTHLAPLPLLPAGATPVQIAARQAIMDSNERALKAAIADLGEDGVKIVDPGLTSGRGARSETFIQMTSGKQYKKIVENTWGDGKGGIRDARFKSILDPATSNLDFEKRIKGLDPADIAHLANNANPGTQHQVAFQRMLNLPYITDHLNGSKLGKAFDDEGLNSAKAIDIITAISRPLPPGATPAQISKQAKLAQKLTDLNFGI